MRRQRFLLKLTAVILALTSAAPVLLNPSVAQAAYRVCPSAALVFGRAGGCGYFTDQAVTTGTADNVLNDSIGAGIPPGTNSVAGIEAMIANRINSGDGRAREVANAIVFTMLGCDPNVTCVFGGVNLGVASNGNVAVSGTNAFWKAWTDAVGYSSITYHQSLTYACSVTNSLWDPTHNDVVFYTAADRASHEACGPGAAPKDTVSFYNPAHTVLEYQIKWDCGNPIGTLGPLTPKPQNYSNSVTMSVFGSTTAHPGDTMRIDTYVTTANPSVSPELAIANRPTANYDADFSFSSTSPGAGNPGRIDNLGIGYYDWNWPPSSTGSTGPFAFFINVLATTPSGSYCFWAQVAPTNQATPGYSAASYACFTVENPKFPILKVSGDTHAGCTTSGGGTIKTNTGSIGTEVVSASGTISGLASNNGAAGTPNESIKSYSLCRDDLAQTAASYLLSGQTLYTLLAHPACVAGVATVNLSTVTADGLMVIPCAVKLSGTLSHKLTIFSSSGGTITVTGNVIVGTSGSSRQTVPSLGVITAGSMNVAATATEADGYYFADGTINTCYYAPATQVACNNVLQVNGFMMASQVLLNRFGAGANSIGNQLAENIAISGQLYLNPPPIFSLPENFSDFYNGEGEITPRY